MKNPKVPLKVLSFLAVALCKLTALGQLAYLSTENCTDSDAEIHTITFEELKQRPPLSEFLRGCIYEFEGCSPYSDEYPYLEAEHLLEFKNELLECITPETYYLWLANAPVSPHKEAALNWLLENGLDINASLNADELNALEYSLDLLEFESAIHEQMIKLLIEHDAVCSTSKYPMYLWTRHGLESFIKHPETIVETKYKYLKKDTPPAGAPKVPPILHHIWLTHPSSPREISPSNINNIIANKAVFSKSDYHWEHILWVNDKTLIPESVHALDTAGISIREIAGHAEDIGNYAFIEKCIERKYWGMASDALRYSLIAHFGGVYSDVNYTFTRDVTHEILRYDFFGEDLEEDLYVHCCAFGAKPKHPIMLQSVQNVADNISANSLTHLSKPTDVADLTVDTTSMEISNAYFQQAHKHGTIDVIYAACLPPSDDEVTTEDAEAFRERYINKFPSLPERCSEMFDLGQANITFERMRKDYCIPQEEIYGKDKDERSWIEWQ